MQDGNRSQVVGFGLASFVKKSFAEEELRHPRPGLNSRIVVSTAADKSVAASYREVRDANTRGDLQQVILDTSWNNELLTESQRDDVRVLLGQAYYQLFAGYRFSLILTEMVDELDLWHVRGHRALRVVDRYEEYFRANPGTGWNANRALVAVTPDSIRDDPHSVVAGLFHHHVQPRIPFTPREQEMLELAIEGGDDISLAKRLFVTLPAIKRRWSNIFERVSTIEPDICPPDGDGTRGVQKRQRILSFVRQHPEELRPFCHQRGKNSH